MLLSSILSFVHNVSKPVGNKSNNLIQIVILSENSFIFSSFIPAIFSKTSNYKAVKSLDCLVYRVYKVLKYANFLIIHCIKCTRGTHSTLVLKLVTTDLLCGECRARSDCIYVQSDLAMHSPSWYNQFLSTKSNPMLFKQFESVLSSEIKIRRGKN